MHAHATEADVRAMQCPMVYVMVCNPMPPTGAIEMPQAAWLLMVLLK